MRGTGNLRALTAALALAAGAMAGCAEKQPAAAASDRPVLALSSSLPIYWGEDAFGASLSGDEPTPVRERLEHRYRLKPLDRLTELADDGGPARLLLAQPRTLSAAENVALDDWVRGGGRLLLFADPMLTQHSHWPLGDPRRPQDVALLSPILARWGLAMRYDPDPPGGVESIEWRGEGIDLNRAGQFEAIPSAGGAPSDCAIEGKGRIADCRIGAGRALILADAHLLDPDALDGPALDMLLDAAFGE